MTNIKLAKKLIERLVAQGATEFVICSGSRNAPLVEVLRKSDLTLYSGYDEKSAAFYALGRAKFTAQPVVLVTTSGTAVSETFSAVIEAYYAGVPLVVLSADRPRSYRGSGAPQAIRQKNIFGNYARTYDMSSGHIAHCNIEQQRPSHLNVCFDEPCVDDQVSSDKFLTDQKLAPIYKNRSFLEKIKGLLNSADIFSSSMDWSQLKNPLIIVSAIDGRYENQVKQFLSTVEAPIYIEGTSGLRERGIKNQIKSGDLFIKSLKEKNLFSSVLRIGSVPTLGFWRDLEQLELPVLNISQLPFSGLPRIKQSALSIEKFLNDEKPLLKNNLLEEIKKEDHNKLNEVESLFIKYPQSELCFFRKISEQIVSPVFVGNSLPIRHWDLAASLMNDKGDPKVWANRGANGIDGSVSTFLGTGCVSGIFGDLTALYDLSALWWLKDSKVTPHHRDIFVINNGGGRIFSKLYEADIYQNQHNLSFASWASLFGLDYVLWEASEENPLATPVSGSRLIEVRPCFDQTQQFWDSYKMLFSQE